MKDSNPWTIIFKYTPTQPHNSDRGIDIWRQNTTLDYPKTGRDEALLRWQRLLYVWINSTSVWEPQYQKYQGMKLDDLANSRAYGEVFH